MDRPTEVSTRDALVFLLNHGDGGFLLVARYKPRIRQKPLNPLSESWPGATLVSGQEVIEEGPKSSHRCWLSPSSNPRMKRKPLVCR